MSKLIKCRLWNEFRDFNGEQSKYKELKRELLSAAADIPNETKPSVSIGEYSQSREVLVSGQKREFAFKPRSVVQLAEDQLHILRTRNLSQTSGPRTYYFKTRLAKLEQALVDYTLDFLLDKGFALMSVPDLVTPDIVEGCGFKVSGVRTQVYTLDQGAAGGRVCLAGTGEIPLAGYFTNQHLNLASLPQKLMTVSRCYRAETSDIERESGIYRVHQFTKVEMFGVTANETGTESHELLQFILDVETQLYQRLGLYFRVLDMASQELGAPAYTKYDVETWLPAKEFWGEISSASNCTDFQSRRLGIKYSRPDGTLRHSHTVNGTACAVPRLIIALLETYQQKDGSVLIPSVLQPYMGGETTLQKPQTPRLMNYRRTR